MTIESMQANPMTLNAAQIATAGTHQQQGAEAAKNTETIKEVAPTEQVATQDTPSSTGLNQDQLEGAIDRLNELMKDGQRSLAFSVDSDSEEVVVKVVDTNTDEVIRQIPNEEALRFAEHVEGMLGVIFNDKA